MCFLLLSLSRSTGADDGIVDAMDYLGSWPILLKTDLQLIRKRVARNPSALSGRVERVDVVVN